MSRFGEKKRLAELAVSLIVEYEELASEIRNSIESVEVDGSYENLIITDEDGTEEYHLSEILYYYEEEQESGDFIEAIEEQLEKAELKEQFEELDKGEFINYVGTLYYARFRCREIYAELRRISEYF